MAQPQKQYHGNSYGKRELKTMVYKPICMCTFFIVLPILDSAFLVRELQNPYNVIQSSHFNTHLKSVNLDLDMVKMLLM